jgi:chemotaxis protein MotB
MGKKKCPECEECLPAWLAAFGDLMSLLLCFFVLLLSMSSMDAKKVSEAIGSLSGAMSVLEGGTQTEISKKRIQESTPIETKDETSETVNRIQQAIADANEMQQKQQGPEITLDEAEEGFVINMPATLLFKAGSATIDNQDAILFLKRMSLLIDEMPNDVEVSIQGHTDDGGPGVNSPFKDNWELSTARAISVLKELEIDGVDPKRMNATGYAQYHPVATNATKIGREKNRRVELRFFGKKTKSSKNQATSVLDKAKM